MTSLKFSSEKTKSNHTDFASEKMNVFVTKRNNLDRERGQDQNISPQSEIKESFRNLVPLSLILE